MGYGPEKQQNRSGAQKPRHGVDHQGHFRHIAESEVSEETRRKHEDRVARRVSDFQFVTLQNEFRTVPETCCRLEGHEIGDRGNDKTEPAE